MGDDLLICFASCQNTNNSGALVGNDSYDLECITQCSQIVPTLYQHTSENYETTITLTTSCVFLTTNSIASTYVYVKSSHRSNRSRLTEDVKTSNVYLILRMLTLIDTVLEFYIYFLTGKKFRQEVCHVIREILQHTPLRHFFKFTRLTNNNINNGRPQKKLSEKQLELHQQQENHFNKQNHVHYLNLIQSAATTTTTMSRGSSYIDSPRRHRIINFQWYDPEESLDRIESTV
ncbi:unnamed protein product [Rotaria sp. Silwood2]|nr:unnamed protein product [Rotaria sp. Silwood2]